jgi:hypothetical protein
MSRNSPLANHVARYVRVAPGLWKTVVFRTVFLCTKMMLSARLGIQKIVLGLKYRPSIYTGWVDSEHR